MGRFIVIEGLDGAGTTTQAQRLADHLREGSEVVQTHEPTDGPVGRVIRATLQRAAGAPLAASLPWLFAADRSDHLARTVVPALQRGAWVISDRYYHSSLAYQSLDHPLAWVHTLNQHFRVPDLTLFLGLDVEVCLARISARGEAREIFEERQALERISARYDAVLELLGGLGEPIVRLDADRSIDALALAIREQVEALG